MKTILRSQILSLKITDGCIYATSWKCVEPFVISCFYDLVNSRNCLHRASKTLQERSNETKNVSSKQTASPEAARDQVKASEGDDARCQARCCENEYLKVHFSDDETRGTKRVARMNRVVFNKKAYIRTEVVQKNWTEGILNKKGKDGERHNNARRFGGAYDADCNNENETVLSVSAISSSLLLDVY